MQGTIIRYTFEEIAKILLEARQPGVSEAQTCWKYGITPTMIRLWQVQSRIHTRREVIAENPVRCMDERDLVYNSNPNI